MSIGRASVRSLSKGSVSIGSISIGRVRIKSVSVSISACICTGSTNDAIATARVFL